MPLNVRTLRQALMISLIESIVYPLKLVFKTDTCLHFYSRLVNRYTKISSIFIVHSDIQLVMAFRKVKASFPG